MEEAGVRAFEVETLPTPIEIFDEATRTEITKSESSSNKDRHSINLHGAYGAIGSDTLSKTESKDGEQR